jgi:hypothetical protein
MTQRSQEIIKTIKKAGSEAGDRTLDLNRKEVEDLRQNTKKTYKQFLEAVTPKLGMSKSYGDSDYQERLQKQRKKEQEKKEAGRQKTSDELYKERTRGRGIRATNKEGQKGWIKNGKFTVGDW